MNKNLFQSTSSVVAPATNAVNHAGGKAYQMTDKLALAQLVVTGTLTDTFYATAEGQLTELLTIAKRLVKTDPEYIAKTAIYARDRAFMKDTPVLLLGILASETTQEARNALKKAFNKVIDNGKMLKNFAQVIRSGKVGRKSFGTGLKRLMQNWIQNRRAESLFKDSIGNDPSLADVIKMVHVKPKDSAQASLFAYLLGQNLNDTTAERKTPVSVELLPEVVQAFEGWKKNPSQPIPDVPFQMLTSVPLTKEQWLNIALNASWQTLRMNLNTFTRHGVFSQNAEAAGVIAKKLQDPEQIKRAKVFPYQLLMTYKALQNDVPDCIRKALEVAMEIAIENVPGYSGNVVICPDVSGSMRSAVTGSRGSATSSVRCIDVAGLVAASLLRKNETARVLPFEESVVTRLDLKREDSVITNATKLASIGGGGTNCSAPLIQLNSEKAKVDLVVFISDNESWVDKTSYRSTAVMQQWMILKKRNPNAKMICIDITPNTTAQVVPDKDILTVGGFSDAVFDVCHLFLIGRSGASAWLGEIENIVL